MFSSTVQCTIHIQVHLRTDELHVLGKPVAIYRKKCQISISNYSDQLKVIYLKNMHRATTEYKTLSQNTRNRVELYIKTD